jgi:hypothetical protein
MDIQVGPPPMTERTRRDTWHPELEAAMVQANGEWVSVPADEIEGKGHTVKRSRIYAVMARRGFRISVTIQDGRFYARLRVEK